MLKKIKIVFALLLLVAVASVALVACQNNNTEEQDAGFILRLKEGSPTSYTFVKDNIDYSQIEIEQVATADNKVLTTFYASASLVSSEDLAKLKNPGTYNIKFTYSGVSVGVTITIKTQEEIPTYMITYYAGLGKFAQTSQNIMSATLTTVETLPIPIREGYEFGGWYFNVSYTGDKLIAPYELNADVNVYAKWIDQRQFTVIFKSDISQEVIQRYDNVEYGTKVIAPDAPEIEGYNFTGWRGSFSNVTEDATIWAEYSRIRITVTFTSEIWSETIGYSTKTIILNYGESLEDEEALPGKEGYDGVWLDDATGAAPKYDNLTKDLSITAHYTIKTYTVNFYTPEDYTTNTNYSIEFTRTVDYNTNILQVPQVPAHDGYLGVWQEYYNGRLVDADLTKNVTANVNVYAKYAKRFYDVTYNYDGNTQKISCAYGDVIDALDVGLDPKYYTVEWYNAQTYATDKKVVFPYTVKTAVSFYMKKTALPYKVDFCMPDEVGGKAIDYYYGSKIINTTYVTPGASVNPPTISLQKYNLVGWIDATTGLDANFDSVGDFHEYNADSALDKAYYAKLEVKVFNIDFYNMVIVTGDEGIDVYSSEKIEIGGQDHFQENVEYDTVFKTTPDSLLIITPEYPDYDPLVDEPSDFEFVGWFTTPDFTTAAIDFEEGYLITANVQFYAKWVDKNKGSEELIYKLNDDNTTFTVVGFNSTNLKYTTISEVNIPRSYSLTVGVVGPVVAIAENAFAGTETIKIQAIEITKNMLDIYPNAFASCKYLKEFKFRDDEPSPNFTIGEDGVLYSADKTILYKYPNAKVGTSFEIPNTVTTISGGAFTFSNLQTITFETGSQLKTIGNGAFSAMSNLTSIGLPGSLETIEADAFRDCGFLASVTIDSINNLTTVGAMAFDNTKWWMDSVKNDKKVVIGKVLLSYNDYTVTTLDLSEYIAITDGALGGAEGSSSHTSTFAITEIIIGESSQLTKIGEYAFSACVNLNKITVESYEEIDVSSTAFDGISRQALLRVNSTMYSYYSTNAAILCHFDADYIIEI